MALAGTNAYETVGNRWVKRVLRQISVKIFCIKKKAVTTFRRWTNQPEYTQPPDGAALRIPFRIDDTFTHEEIQIILETLENMSSKLYDCIEFYDDTFSELYTNWIRIKVFLNNLTFLEFLSERCKRLLVLFRTDDSCWWPKPEFS